MSNEHDGVKMWAEFDEGKFIQLGTSPAELNSPDGDGRTNKPVHIFTESSWPQGMRR